MLPDKAANEIKQNRVNNVLDRRKVTPQTKQELARNIAEVDDPDAREALALMFEILTGEDPPNK